MIRARRESVYRCPVDETHEVRDKAARRVICPYCKVAMVEAVRGVITKAGVISGREDQG